MRLAVSILALVVAMFGALPGAAVAAAGEPKVVLIVGPAGEATDRYRARAEAAAQVAERFTSNVVRLYSPNATWPAVRRALEGAAVVVYLGHGNGWPSRYRDAPYGGTQNGFGLNPVAGGGDHAHQYFGEDRIASEVRLARNAVVLLHHLCYASGNTEPGLPEGTVDQARMRVEGYAGGFIRAGAGAVVAEGHMGPAWYVERLLGTEQTIQKIWAASPNSRGNTFSFKSSLSDGYVASLDPDQPGSGFYRSLVARGGVGGGNLQPGPDIPAGPAVPPEPTLVGTGLAVQPPYFKTRPLAGERADLWIPFATENAASLEGLSVGVRWDPIDVDEATRGDGETVAGEAAEPATEPAAAPAPTPEPPAEPSEASGAAPTAEPSPDPGASATPSAGPPEEADPTTARFTFIEPERIGDVVEPIAAKVGKTRIVANIAFPNAPGRYRLVTTLHDSTGVAYDAATQALMSGLIVQVSGELAVQYLVPQTADAAPGGTLDLPVAVANVGTEAWGQAGAPGRRNLEERPTSAVLTAHWVRLNATPEAELPADVSYVLPAGFAAGASERLSLALPVPKARGTYLLVIDVVAPDIGSLTAHGIEPALIRVAVH